MTVAQPVNLSPPSRPRRRGRLVFAAAVGLFAVWAVGQTARDATWLTGLAFYVPSPVVAAGLLLAAALLAARRGRRFALLTLAFAFGPLAFVLLVENNFFTHHRHPPGNLRLVHWNIKGRPDRPGIADRLAAEHADLYVLSESASLAWVENFRRSLPDADAFRAAEFDSLAVVGRGEVRANGWLVHRHDHIVWSVTWTPPGGRPLEVLVVDLPSDLRVPRAPLLREVNALIESRRPDLVVGDFNAPRRSWGLANLPAGYAHAYDAAGGGWGSTWPSRLPLFAIDQCVFGPRVAPAAYRIGPRGGSPHRYQAFDFSFRV